MTQQTAKSGGLAFIVSPYALKLRRVLRMLHVRMGRSKFVYDRMCPVAYFTAALLMVSFAGSAMAQDRMPEIPADKMTPAQKEAAAQYVAGRGTPVVGPFIPLLRSPEVLLRAKAMGDYLRFKAVLPPKLRELAILVTARQWTQQYEWSFHSDAAIKAGLSPEIIKAIADGRRPTEMSQEEEIVHDFCIELHRNKSVSDATYFKAVTKFGEQGVIDLTGIEGYYTFLSMVMNVARTPAPKGKEPALVPFPH